MVLSSFLLYCVDLLIVQYCWYQQGLLSLHVESIVVCSRTRHQEVHMKNEVEVNTYYVEHEFQSNDS
jgi:hypothetical protein